MWLRLMAVVFLANGLGPFGLRVLADKGLVAAPALSGVPVCRWTRARRVSVLAEAGTDTPFRD